MAEKNVLDVQAVGLHDKLPLRVPESFPFPACMTSLVNYLGGPYADVTLHAHDREYILRTANREFLSATGMGFGLLWRRDHCMSSLDLMQVDAHARVIARGFAWAGYEYDALDMGVCGARSVRERVVASIDAGMPVLGFGIFGTPECFIICGYDGGGDTLIGWSHFQKGFPTCENGMFRVSGW